MPSSRANRLRPGEEATRRHDDLAESRRVIGLFAAWGDASALARKNPVICLRLLELLTLRGLYPRVFRRRGAGGTR